MRKYKIAGFLVIVSVLCLLLSIHINTANHIEETAPTKQVPEDVISDEIIKVSPEVISEMNFGTTGTTPYIPVLMYHILLEDQNNSISVDPLRFKEQMSAIKEAGYSTITDYELANHLKDNTKLPEKPILITFDDGYKSVFTEAFPILKDLDMKATVYVIASRTFETPSTLHPEEYEKFTWPEARLMQGTVMVQAHTWDSHYKKNDEHNELRGVLTGRMSIESGLETQEEFEKRVFADLLLSKKTIEEKMGYDVITLAYPYGDYSTDTIRLAQVAGYKMAFTVESGLVNRETDEHFELDRITADGAFSGEQLLAKIESSR